MHVGELCVLKCDEQAGFESGSQTLRCQPNGFLNDPVSCKKAVTDPMAPIYYYYAYKIKNAIVTPTTAAVTAGPSTSLRGTTVDSLATSIDEPTSTAVLTLSDTISKTIASITGPSSAATTITVTNKNQPMNFSAGFLNKAQSEEPGFKAVDTWFFALVAVVLLVVLMVGEIVFVSFFLALKNKKQAT